MSTVTSTNPLSTPAESRTTRGLLACGIAAGPLFVLLIVAQALTRNGFDATRHPLSMLSLGAHGWIQIGNFVVCGALALASAVGLRRALDRTRTAAWASALVGVYGASLIWAGIFPTDPADGFPLGTPDGAPAEVSWHGMLHNLAPVGSGLAVSAACAVFAYRYARARHRGWAYYCALAPILYFALGFTAFPLHDYRLMLAGGALVWTCASACTLKTLTEMP
ncbi:DUF998 domain-containing protein [Nocardia mexicana]|uniref:Uncharacterized protein DUF998 n=1 Tax=Nocardia mexicana TaxID=279262 RepID=A0A370HCC8_9NOCA|nr:DUF998 domain-containing protein [Nocardia mexicana]RDI54592.1 uncharacterized protein DUF998 [Nocardia mexicana]